MVLVNDLVQNLLDMDARTWQITVQNARQQFARLCQQIANLQAHLSLIEIPVPSPPLQIQHAGPPAHDEDTGEFNPPPAPPGDRQPFPRRLPTCRPTSSGNRTM